jgi:hypothetical protein
VERLAGGLPRQDIEQAYVAWLRDLPHPPVGVAPQKVTQ